MEDNVRRENAVAWRGAVQALLSALDLLWTLWSAWREGREDERRRERQDREDERRDAAICGHEMISYSSTWRLAEEDTGVL